jgi:CubicO group peptidase (beta-lactamase class C family)
MSDSSFRFEAGFEERIVKRSPDAQGHTFLNSREFLDRPDPPGGLLTTAGDLAIFCQAFLSGGRHGDFRLLSAGTVDEMTKNQIPGTGTVNSFGDPVAEASWGLGWMIQGHARWAYSHGALQPRGTFYHQGLRGCGMWVDPINEIVGVFLSVAMHVHEAVEEDDWDYDLFQNMVTAAVAD